MEIHDLPRRDITSLILRNTKEYHINAVPYESMSDQHLMWGPVTIMSRQLQTGITVTYNYMYGDT